MTTATAPLPTPPRSVSPASHRLELVDLVKIYRGKSVVDGVTLNVSTGEIVGLLGKNGAGKTTAFNMTVGLIRPDRGRILLDGQDITRLPMYQRARLGIGYLTQQESVFQKLSALENILLVLEMTGYPAAKRRARADELLAELHIGHIADSKGYSLSGGERRRVEIARALSMEPKFLLLDEPFGGVDPIAREDISGIVRSLRDRGIGILITDHDALTTLRLSDRVYLMYTGKVGIEGTPEQIAADDLARKHYLGENFQF